MGGGLDRFESFLAQHLEPTYIRDLPAHDGWGRELLYWSNHYGYTIITVGADGERDSPYDTWSAEQFRDYYGGAVGDLRRDLLFREGTFVQWPLGVGIR